MKIKLLLISTLCWFSSPGQNSWVYLSDKCNPTEDFFSSPVCEDYILEIKQTGVEVKGSSKWLNAVLVSSSEASKLETLPFVAAIESCSRLQVVEESTDEIYQYGASDYQIEMLGLDRYHALGYTGKGVNLALFDAGFRNVDSLFIFDSIRDNNQIIATYDFVLNDTMSYVHSRHGMQVLALVGANYPDSMIGASPGANFVLARTEDAPTETHKEEYNWFRAMEWADSVGVDIIHSSLGYSEFDSLEGDYTYTDMDGKSTIITISAELAASRGIFITNSAGNSGAKPWNYITAPCDGKSVLCVGAVDSFEVIAAFSSKGPSSDGRVKPNVSAMGKNATVPHADGVLFQGSGTSFSGPLIAGLVACLMEAHPTKSNQDIFKAIEQSCDRYSAPDTAYGYGIPNVLIADSLLTNDLISVKTESTTLDITVFPNPASKYIKVACEPNSSYRIYSLKGELIAEGKLVNWMNFIDLEAVSAGQYYFEVMHEEKVAVEQIIVR